MKVLMVGYLGSVKARVQGPIACRNSPSGNVEGSFKDASLEVWIVLWCLWEGPDVKQGRQLLTWSQTLTLEPEAPNHKP